MTIGSQAADGVGVVAHDPLNNPTGAVLVTEMVASHQTVVVDGGSSVIVSAMGQEVEIGEDTGTTGPVTVNEGSVYTGNALGGGDSNVFVDGGTRTVPISEIKLPVTMAQADSIVAQLR